MPGSAVLGAGTKPLRNLLAYGAMRLAGMMFPANGAPVAGSMMIADEEEKFPVRNAAGGTSAWPPNEPATCRPDSQLKKKKVLFFPLKILGIQTGPPKLEIGRASCRERGWTGAWSRGASGE